MLYINGSISNWLKWNHEGHIWLAQFFIEPSNRTILLAVVLSVLFISLVLHSLLRQPKLDKRTLFFALFEDDVRAVFRRQEHQTMDTIITGVNSILHQNPERPTVLLLLASPDAHSTALRLAQAVSIAVVFCFSGCWYPNCEAWTITGRDYSAMEAFWDFHADLSRCMARHNVVILTDLHRVHPHVALALLSLMDDTYSPLPQSLVIILIDIMDRFSNEELRTTSPVNLAESFLSEQWESSIDRHMLTRLLNVLTGRAVIVNSEL